MKLVYSAEFADHPPDAVFAWHERSGALKRLLPPWVKAEIASESGGVKDGGVVEMRIRYGPAVYKWKLRHTGYAKGERFVDEQVSGPFRSWRHEHLFEAMPDGGTKVTDRIELEPPLGAASGLAPARIERELGRLFRFRYRRLARDLARHRRYAGRPALTVGVTGASGMVGSALCAFLETGGHRVVRFVRRRDELRRLPEGAAAFWNPAAGEIDRDALRGLDAMVHLAGASIAKGRWTPDRMRAIRRSRTEGTELAARSLAESARGPRVLISASAVGYYGNRGNARLDESSSPGSGFLASVCSAWEDATRPAERAGIRVAKLRTGVALSPAGGALGQMLLPFKFGVGGRIATGRQYMSWIDADDLTAAIHECLMNSGLRGAVNATAPNPVPNAAFASALGRALGRPTLVPVPSLAIRAAFGRLGIEALLWGQRVMPAKLMEAGFRYDCEGVEDSLRHQLGADVLPPVG